MTTNSRFYTGVPVGLRSNPGIVAEQFKMKQADQAKRML